MERVWIAVAGLSGALAVIADAAARHALADAHSIELAATAARYGLVHAVALTALAALGRADASVDAGGAAWVWRAVTGWCFVLGLVVFCGSLYALAAGAPPGLARVTPWGGTLFILGWVALLLAALSPRPAR
jgi:uncharacterized membrane protein YgdD (TMEM256/DUF423 family)